MSPAQQKELNYIGKLREFFVVFLPFSVLFLIALAAHYYSIHRTEVLTIETREMLNVGLARSALNNDLAAVITDLKFLSNHLESKAFDSSDRFKQQNVSTLLQGFSNQKRLYDQIRFIQADGQEIIRINFHRDKAYEVAEAALQNKADRYYFKKAKNLEAGEVYISPLDLNIEQGQIEKPFKPVIRFATPIFSASERLKGVLVLNYLGDRMLNSFARASANIADHIYLLNQQGYWLHTPDTDKSWGFMLEHGHRFSSDYPTEWQAMQRQASAQIRTSNGLFSYETVTPMSVAAQSLQDSGIGNLKLPHEAEKWFVVSHVDAEHGAPSPLAFLLQHLPLYLAMLTVLVTGSWLLAMSRLKHRRAELEKEYERRFRHVLESMELAAVNVDLDGHIRFCNDSFLSMTGWQRHEILYKDWISRFVTTERQQYVKTIFQDAKQGKSFPSAIEANVKTRDEDTRLISWHNTLSFDTEGNVSGITAIGEDITEKRRAEALVRQLSRAVEHSPSIVMLTNKFGLIDYVNPMFTQVTGYSLEEVKGLNPRVLKSGETSPEDYHALWQTLVSGGVWRGEFHNRRKNGELYWESASISALQNDNGEITNFIAVKEDITERKRMEEKIAYQKEDLARAEALSVMGRMAGMIAHDLRNPLSSVKMTMQILGRHASDEHKELQEIGLGQILYMENILTDMLAYARPDPVRFEEIDITALLQNTIASLQSRIDELKVQATVTFDDNLPGLLGDADKMRRLFGNLIGNALQALEESETDRKELKVTVSLFKEGTTSAIKISICDNGIGLEGVETDKIFEPFFTTRAQGTGLGLAIVRQIVDQYQGSIDLKQNSEGKTCATVIFPANTSEK
ncbi:MAG: PAS domain S-box protein [Gammaproteobacteria bacterium]|nr:PAS domain S-box protein [Gammaproteobacteria bacterium]